MRAQGRGWAQERQGQVHHPQRELHDRRRREGDVRCAAHELLARKVRTGQSFLRQIVFFDAFVSPGAQTLFSLRSSSYKEDAAVPVPMEIVLPPVGKSLPLRAARALTKQYLVAAVAAEKPR